jgi:hypothetical protein
MNVLDLVPIRPLATPRLLVRISLAPGDRALVAPDDTVTAGTPLVERLRDPRIELEPSPAGRPGERVTLSHGRRSDDATTPNDGELLFVDGDRGRVVVGDHADVVESPTAGTVRTVRPGSELTVEASGSALHGVLALGVPTHGRLALANDDGGDLQPGSLNVGRAGTILVVGSRVDAETLTRARAMGVRGVVVAALPAKEERDFAASERRQRAGIHQLPPFAVLVLDGALRRPIAAAVVALLRRLEGRDVGLSLDPPALLFESEGAVTSDPEVVRVRHGDLAGREGRWVGPAGLRRFAAGVHLEAGFVRLDDGQLHALPLADLERFG